MSARDLFAEVIYDLTWNLAHDTGVPPCDDSRAQFSMILGWAEEFTRIYKGHDWALDGDYMELIDQFYERKSKAEFAW